MHITGQAGIELKVQLNNLRPATEKEIRVYKEIIYPVQNQILQIIGKNFW